LHQSSSVKRHIFSEWYILKKLNRLSIFSEGLSHSLSVDFKSVFHCHPLPKILFPITLLLFRSL
ncbi:unnamed protein product, partial [Brassica oleracea var. botrytis]